MHRFVELFLALRYLRPKGSFVSVITILSMTGVFLGVGVLIVVLSVMEGFERDFQDKLIGFTPHLRVTNDFYLKKYEDLQKQLEELEGVKGVAPYIRGPIIAEYRSRVTTPVLWGSHWETESGSSRLNKEHLIAGEWAFGFDTVMVGRIWAMKNDVWVGDKILIHSPKNIERLKSLRGARDEHIQSAFAIPNEYTVNGIFSSGLGDYDANVFLLDLGLMQDLYSLDNGAHGLEVRLQYPLRANEIKKQILAIVDDPTLQIRSWKDDNSTMLNAVAVEQKLIFFVLFFVILVAAFGLCSTLITVTVQKAKEIGIMKALGATEEQIAYVFTLYGLVVGIIGSVLGVIGGLVVLYYRNQISEFLTVSFGVEIFPVEVYNLTHLPAVFDAKMIAGIAIIGLVLSVLAALIPAFSAARLDPVKALHGE